jgi:transposase
MVGVKIVRKILEMVGQGSSLRGIAEELTLSRNTVRRYVRAGGRPECKKRKAQVHKLDPFREYIKERWQKGITNGRVLLREIKERGYTGGYTALKDLVRPWREQKHLSSKATVRFETLPGEQAQVDFGRFKYRASDGSSQYLWAFVMVLGWSRAMYVEFIPKANLRAFIGCHLRAFEYLGGIPQHCLYDQTKLVVLGRDENNQPLWNESFLEFALTLGFNTRACKPYRARTKGKVERGIGYLEGNFWIAAEFTTLSDLNQKAIHWLDTEANPRVHGTTFEPPARRLLAERPWLKALPPPQVWQGFLMETRRVNIDGYFSYEASLYAVPLQYINQSVQVLAEGERLKAYAGGRLVAEHPRAKEPHQRVGLPLALLVSSQNQGKGSNNRSEGKNTKIAQQIVLPHTEVQVRSLQQYAELADGAAVSEAGSAAAWRSAEAAPSGLSPSGRSLSLSQGPSLVGGKA